MHPVISFAAGGKVLVAAFPGRPVQAWGVRRVENPEPDTLAGGRWERADSGFLVHVGERSLMVLPVVPQGSYEFEFQFVVMIGIDVNAIFPVGAGSVVLVLHGWGGRTSGLEYIRGKGGDINETAVTTPLIQPGRLHRAAVRVVLKGDDALVTVALDENKPFIQWSDRQSELALPPYWVLPAKGLLAIAAHDSTVRFPRARLRMLSGMATRRRMADPVTR